MALAGTFVDRVEEPSALRVAALGRLADEVDRPDGLVAHAQFVVVSAQIQLARAAAFA